MICARYSIKIDALSFLLIQYKKSLSVSYHVLNNVLDMSEIEMQR